MADRELAALLEVDPAAFAHHLLTSLGLPAAPLVPASGWSNRVWLAPAHAVRMSSGRFHNAFAHEVATLHLLPLAVPHAPVRAYGCSGEREWFVQDRRPGQPLGQVWAGLPRVQRRAAIAQLGAMLRALHEAPLPSGYANPWLEQALAPGGHVRDAYHAPPGRAQVLLDAVATLPGADQGLLDDVGAFIAERLDAFAGDRPVLVHSDVHFANLLWDGGQLTALLDFEGARPAAADLELDTLLRYCREPALFRGPGETAGPEAAAFAAVPGWLAAAYPDLFAHPRLSERLAVYEALWHLVQALHFPAGPVPPDPWGHLRALLAGRR
jgi:aminoglycoside phosphotransferase (APT) family kinase protein